MPRGAFKATHPSGEMDIDGGGGGGGRVLKGVARRQVRVGGGVITRL